MRRDCAALEPGKWRGPAQRVAQLLVAVAVEVGPDAQRALIGADPRSDPDSLSRKEAALEVAVVGDVEVRPQEAANGLAEQRSIAYILIDKVMDGRRARWNGLTGMHERIHGVGDAPAANHVDAGDFENCILGGINPGGLYVDYADQGAGSLGCDCRPEVAHEVVNVCGRVVTLSKRGGRRRNESGGGCASKAGKQPELSPMA